MNLFLEIIEPLLKLWLNWAPFLVTLACSILAFRLFKFLLSSRFDSTFSESRLALHLTYLGLFAFSLLMLILAMPLDEAIKGQLLTLTGLMGSAVVALSSTTFVGNAMAGLMLRTVQNFKPGDFLRVGEHLGRISEFGFLHTEIQTEDSDLTTLPNLYLVTNPVTVVRKSGTIVSATVSLSYDISREFIEKALEKAANESQLTDTYVQILELGDFSVTYRVAGFLKEVKQLISARSRLRKNILDELHKARIEIVSPNFMNQRILDPKQAFIPEVSSIPRVPTPTPAESAPEALIFEKADQAQSAEEIKALIKNLEGKVAEFNETKEHPNREHKTKLLEDQIKRLKEIYKNKNENL